MAKTFDAKIGKLLGQKLQKFVPGKFPS